MKELVANIVDRFYNKLDEIENISNKQKPELN